VRDRNRPDIKYTGRTDGGGERARSLCAALHRFSLGYKAYVVLTPF